MTTHSMTHQQAMESMAAERYLLGEMTAEQRLGFEEHYVECAECLESVMFGSEFLDAGHQVAVEDKREDKPMSTWRERLLSVSSGFLNPVPAMAFALLLGLVGYQAFRINALKNEADEKVATAEYRYFLTGIVHGAGDANVVQVPHDAVVGLQLEYKRSGDYLSYRARIEGGSSVKQNVDVPNLPGDVASIALMPGTLHDGDYTIVILGKTADGSEQEVGRGRFRLMIKDK